MRDDSRHRIAATVVFAENLREKPPDRDLRSEHAVSEFDLMIVATLDRSGQPLDDLIKLGIPRDKLYPLRRVPEPVPAPKRARSRNGKHS